MNNQRRNLALPIVIVAGVCLIGLFVVVPVVALLAGAGGSGDPDEETTVLDAMDVTIEISDFTFDQSNLSVPRGARVTWVNTGSAPHDATESDHAWQTQTLEENESETITFAEPENYDYYCTIHPGMRGKLTVR